MRILIVAALGALLGIAAYQLTGTLWASLFIGILVGLLA